MATRKHADIIPGKSAKTERPFDNFYEAMPLTGMPHSIYSDDVTDTPYHDTADDEINAAKRDLTALATLALVVLVLTIMIAAVLFGLAAISSSTPATGSLTSGSLEL
jgi:hypothetical protein